MWKVTTATANGADIDVQCTCLEDCIRLDSLQYPTFWTEIDIQTLRTSGRFEPSWFDTDTEKVQHPRSRLHVGTLQVTDEHGKVLIVLEPEL